MPVAEPHDPAVIHPAALEGYVRYDDWHGDLHPACLSYAGDVDLLQKTLHKPHTFFPDLEKMADDIGQDFLRLEAHYQMKDCEDKCPCSRTRTYVLSSILHTLSDLHIIHQVHTLLVLAPEAETTRAAASTED